MKKSNTNAFVSQMLVCSLLLIGVAGAGGVTAVWQRQAIAATANSIKQIEQQIIELERGQAEVTAAVAAEQTLDALNRRNQQWALGLAQVRESQVVRVDGLPERRLAAKRNAEILAGGASIDAPIDAPGIAAGAARNPYFDRAGNSAGNHPNNSAGNRPDNRPVPASAYAPVPASATTPTAQPVRYAQGGAR